MKFSYALCSVLSLVSAASATCYTSGEDWGDTAVALRHAHRVCKKHLHGEYGPGGTPSGYRGKCVNGNGKKLEFQIWHIDDGDRQLGVAECFSGLSKEINGCDKGGDTSYTNWRYKYVCLVSWGRAPVRVILSRHTNQRGFLERILTPVSARCTAETINAAYAAIEHNHEEHLVEDFLCYLFNS